MQQQGVGSGLVRTYSCYTAVIGHLLQTPRHQDKSDRDYPSVGDAHSAVCRRSFLIGSRGFGW